MNYSIAVRSYRRVKLLATHTYAMLKRNSLLHRTTVFVQDAEDYNLYTAAFPDVKIVLTTGKSGEDAFRVMCDYYPPNHPIVFFDDDVEDFFTFDADMKLTKKATTLHETLLEGFKLIDEHNLGSFTFLFSDNRLHARAKPRVKFQFRFLFGGAFGCRNEKDLIFTQSTQDDVERTARFFKKYGGVLNFFRCGFKINVGCGEGGNQDCDMRKAETRLEATRKSAEELLPRYPEVFAAVKYNPTYNWHDLKFHHPITLAKKLRAIGTPVRQLAWE